MEELLKSDAFCTGVAAGISLYQSKVIAAHKHKEPIKIGDTLYFLQDGRERLEELLEKICR